MGFDVGGVVLSANGGVLSVDNGATNWMKVNANGILTRPQTPFFRGQISGRGSLYNGNPLLVTADVNFGNCWNNATGFFTCPVAGDYMASMFSIAGPGYGYLYLMKNGANQRFNHWNFATSSWHVVTMSGVVRCAASDTISWAVINQSPTTTGVHGNTNHAMYSIALLA